MYVYYLNAYLYFLFSITCSFTVVIGIGVVAKYLKDTHLKRYKVEGYWIYTMVAKYIVTSYLYQTVGI